MFPLCWPLSAVVDPSRDLAVGDLAAFLSIDGRRLNFHRVVERDDEGYLTRGDTNRRSDRPVPRDAIVGRVSRIELGGLGIDLPRSGAIASLQRRSGLAWGRIAPFFFGLFGRLRSAKV
jgi:hypothetical protein